MKKTLKLLLGISAAALVITAAVIWKYGKLTPVNEDDSTEEITDPLPSGLYTKTRFKAIAKNLKSNIEEIEDRTSPNNHKKLKKEYEKMKWDQN